MSAHTPNVRDARLLGRALDAVVRSIRLGTSTDDAALSRLRDLWAGADFAALAVRATELALGDVVVLGGPEQEVRWILPAFMAGLRSLRPHARGELEPLRGLAAALARLEPSASSVERFRDWLWSGGAVGVEIELQTAFTEIIDPDLPPSVVEPDGFLDRAVSAVRGDAAAALGDDVRDVASADIDLAAVREEFDVASESVAAGVQMDEGRRGALRWRISEPAHWDLLESAVTLAAAPLRAGASPEALGRRFESALGRVCDPDVLDLLASCVRRNDPFARAVLARVEDPALGGAVVRTLSATPDGRRVLGNLFLACAPSLASRIAHGLLDRAGRSPEGLEALARISASVGHRRFVAGVTPGALTAEETLGAIACCEGSPEDLSVFRGWIADGSVAFLATFVAMASSAHFEALRDALVRRGALLSSGALQSRLLPALLRRGPDGARCFRLILVERQGEGCAPETLQSLARDLLSEGSLAHEASGLLRLRALTPEARAALFAVLADDPASVAALSSWHPQELLDPPDLRAGLKALRAARRDP